MSSVKPSMLTPECTHRLPVAVATEIATGEQKPVCLATDPVPESGLGWLSLQGRWARLLASGEKTVEWRKSAPKELAGGLFVVWESAPGAQALGLARATALHRAPWPQLFERFGARGGATVEELSGYYGEKTTALAIEVVMVERFTPPLPWKLIKPLAGGFLPGPAPRWLQGGAAAGVWEALRNAQEWVQKAGVVEAESSTQELRQKDRGHWRA